MASPRTTILNLPHELLDRVFEYLAWHPQDSLIPSCPDITNISLSCHTLRTAILPALFRHARLKLRWIDGAVTEPGLLKLRRDAPHIFKLVRSVHIQTDFALDHSRNPKLKSFTTQRALHDWRTFSTAAGASSESASAHRRRIEEVAAELYEPQSYSTERESCQTKEIIDAFFGSVGTPDHEPDLRSASEFHIGLEQASLGSQAFQIVKRDEQDPSTWRPGRGKITRTQRLALDALIVCAVSLPPHMHTLIFEAVPVDEHDRMQYSFGLQVCCTAIKIFAGRLQGMTMISRSLDASRRDYFASSSRQADIYEEALTPAVPALRSLQHLTLASTTGQSNFLSRHSLDAIRASVWQKEALSSSITSLSLRNMTDKRSCFFDAIKAFPSLIDLTMSGVKLGPDLGIAFNRQANRTPGDPLWLQFLISIRLQWPTLRIHLGDLLQWHEPQTLPRSAVRWLVEEAVPVGAKVDFEREARLIEDFGAFMTLWNIDDGERGDMARQDAGIGKLKDDVLTSRGKS